MAVRQWLLETKFSTAKISALTWLLSVYGQDETIRNVIDHKTSWIRFYNDNTFSFVSLDGKIEQKVILKDSVLHI